MHKPGFYAVANPAKALWVGGSLNHGGGNVAVTSDMLADKYTLHLISSAQLVFVKPFASTKAPVKAAAPKPVQPPSAPKSDKDKPK